jgi:hypothetical protein
MPSASSSSFTANEEQRLERRAIYHRQAHHLVLPQSMVKTRPSPLLVEPAETSAQRISLDILTHRLKVIVRLNRKRLELPLI